MIFVTGPLYAGKEKWICDVLGWTRADFAEKAVRDVQVLAAEPGDLSALTDRLTAYPVVIATEVGCGVVPTDPDERAARERAGRLACMLAMRADTVVRVCCGIGQVLKGELS